MTNEKTESRPMRGNKTNEEIFRKTAKNTKKKKGAKRAMKRVTRAQPDSSLYA